MNTKVILILIFILIFILIYLFTNNKYGTISIVQPILPKEKCNINLENYIENQSNYIFCKNDNINFRNFITKSIKDVLADEKLRLIITPTGIVDWYDANIIDIKIDKNMGKIWGRKKNSKDNFFELKQYQHDMDVKNVDYYHKDTTKNYFISPREKYYLRTIGSKLDIYKNIFPSVIPVDKIVNISFYISGKGIITNLHVDSRSGIIIQIKGRKRVYVFPKNDTKLFEMYPIGHPLERRSKIDGILSENTIKDHPQLKKAKGVECILEPGTWLYIPALWLHYVETLDDETFSLIVRFNK